MAFVPQPLDIPLGTLDQVPPDTAPVMGRIKRLIDGQIVHFTQAYAGATSKTPAAIKVDPRDAFTSLTTTARSIIDGTVIGDVTWSNPQVLEALGKQLVQVNNGVPSVRGSSTWTTYQDNRVLTNTLSQDVLHTSQHTIQAPDYAVIGNVKCSVWTETDIGSTGAITTSWIEFTDVDGQTLIQPTVLYASSSASIITQGRVCSDGNNFFVFWNDDADINIAVYDTHGTRLDSGTLALPSPAIYPAPFDVTACTTSGGYTILAAALAATDSDSGIDTYAIKFDGTSLSSNHVALPAVHANFRLRFLRNDFVAGKAYLSTALSGSDQHIYLYEITDQAVTIEGDTFRAPNGGTIDALTGAITSADGFSSAIISFTQLATETAASGPAHDPQRRWTTTIAPGGDGWVTVRTTQSVALVTSPFFENGEPYAIGYYESGAGKSILPTSIDVSLTDGDYMVGAATQPVTVTPGDSTQGSPLSLTSSSILFAPTVIVSAGSSAQNVVSGDTVTIVAASGASTFGIPDGTPVLRWKFANLGTNVSATGSRLTLSGTNITGEGSAADGSWDIIYIGSTNGSFYTTLQNTAGSTYIPNGTFTTAGTVTLTSLVSYEVEDLSQLIDDSTVGFFKGGTAVVAGASVSGNNGTFTVERVYHGTGPNYGVGNAAVGMIWVPKTTQSTSSSSFTVTLSPTAPNRWAFIQGGPFDSSYVGANLVVSADPAVAINVGTYPITAVDSSTQLVTGDATAILPQIFEVPLPSISVQLTTQVPYTFKFQSLTPDYRYQNAIIAIQNAYANNVGSYKIIQINSDGTMVALPTNGLSNQVNETFDPLTVTATIFLNPISAPQFQPHWCVLPLAGKQPIAGRFEVGYAVADWRCENDPTFGPVTFPNALSTPQVTAAGVELLLPYRAQAVTTSTPLLTVAGQVPTVQPGTENTVGLKIFTLGNPGQSFVSTGNQLMLPGPLSTAYSSGFFEDSIGISPEQPYLVSQSVGDPSILGLTPGGTYQWIVTFEYTLENGDRLFSVPSPALSTTMSGSNNVATIGGRLPFPLDSNGNPVDITFGPCTRQITISVYRTAIQGGVPTKEHYKITNDLNVNGLAPYSTTNPSGFSFPDSFTWQLTDSTPDIVDTSAEILYTDKKLQPRFPAPPFRQGIGDFRNRDWVVGYDDAVWVSFEKTEGDGVYYHPGLRFPFAGIDKPLAVAPLEGYLVVFCEESIWYIPVDGQELPNATLTSGALPTPVPLRFPNGSVNGICKTIRNGVAYDSTAGGVWLITPTLDNQWLGHAVRDTLTNTITGMALDKNQRLFIQQADSSQLHVFDGVPAAFYQWNLPTAPRLIASYLGEVAYQDTSTVNLVDPNAVADHINGTIYGFAPDITLAPLGFGSIRGVHRVWKFQVIGQYLGAHRLNVALSYPQDTRPGMTYPPFIPDPTKPYLYEFRPRFVEASLYGLRIWGDFTGLGTPGASFSLEMIGVEVGVDPGRFKQLPASSRLPSGS